MGIALYYSLLIGAVIGSICYLIKGVKLWQEQKTAQEDQPTLKTIALLETAIGAFGVLLWEQQSYINIQSLVGKQMTGESSLTRKCSGSRTAPAEAFVMPCFNW